MTDEIPNRACGVGGCDDAAVARLFDRGDDKGLRCGACLRDELGV